MSEDQNDHMYCTKEETDKRLSFCIGCEDNIFDVLPKCNQCNCSISMLTTMSFKSCPVEKW